MSFVSCFSCRICDVDLPAEVSAVEAHCSEVHRTTLDVYDRIVRLMKLDDRSNGALLAGRNDGGKGKGGEEGGGDEDKENRGQKRKRSDKMEVETPTSVVKANKRSRLKPVKFLDFELSR